MRFLSFRRLFPKYSEYQGPTSPRSATFRYRYGSYIYPGDAPLTKKGARYSEITGTLYLQIRSQFADASDIRNILKERIPEYPLPAQPTEIDDS